MSNMHSSEVVSGPEAHAPETGPAAPSASAPPLAWQGDRPQMFDPRRKSPFTAALLSVIPGLGNIYIGYYVRGFVTVATIMMLGVMAGLTANEIGPVFGMAAFFVWLFNIIDAGRMAALYNHAMAGRDSIELPEDFKLPTMGGSIVGGAVLLLFGAIAMSNTVFGIRLDWLETWWPIFPLALGGYLFVRGVKDYQEGQQRSTAARDSFVDNAD